MNPRSKKIADWLIGTGFMVLLYGIPQGAFFYFLPGAFGIDPNDATTTAIAFSAACLFLGGASTVTGEWMIKKNSRNEK